MGVRACVWFGGANRRRGSGCAAQLCLGALVVGAVSGSLGYRAGSLWARRARVNLVGAGGAGRLGSDAVGDLVAGRGLGDALWLVRAVFARCLLVVVVWVCWDVAAVPSAASAASATSGSGGWVWSEGQLVDPRPPFGLPLQLEGVSCPSVSMCVAVGYGAAGTHVLSSRSPTSGFRGWDAAPVAPYGSEGRGVSCPSVKLCVAVDADGDVISSSTPDGGKEAWTVTHVESAGFTGVSCPSVRLCVAVATVTGGHYGVVALGGDIVTSTDPTGGSGAWKIARVESNPNGLTGFGGVSCPSVSLCVVVDDSGRVLTATDPSDGTGAWQFAGVDSSRSLSGVSCPSVSLCVATDDAGNVVTSTDPLGGAGAWQAANVDGQDRLTGVSCASVSLCVAVGPPGRS